MLTLSDRKWKEFNFIDLFDIRKGFYNKKPSGSGYGRIPFLGATERNNGITSFHTVDDIKQSSKMGYGKNESIDKKIFSGNCIAVTNDGSVGHAFYQKIPFTCSHSINPLYLINYELNEKISLFLIRMIEMQRVCFQYSRKWRSERMEKSKILLPRNEQGEPDWIFMENYIKQIENIQKEKYKAFALKKLENLEYKEIPKLNEKTWKAFYFKDVFKSIQRGKRLKKDDHILGDKPYISSTFENNGIDGFVGNKDCKQFFNCLTIANSGSVGSTFFHRYEFVASDHVTSLKNDSFNEYIYLFIIPIINRLKDKYNFNREINSSRINRERLILPTKFDQTPDYDYMEQYVKNIMYEQLKAYLEKC